MRFARVFSVALFSLLLIVGVHLSSSPSYAQTLTPTQNSASEFEAGVQIDTSARIQQQVNGILGALTCQLVGYNPATANHLCLTTDQTTGKLGYKADAPNLVHGLTIMISYTTLPPIHTADFVQYAAANFGGAQKAYAATGAESLSPLIPIWSAFRNIVYLLYVLAFVIVGFAIMLRLKMDPRTVMTIQNQLPKIIINLILVTFSFAIAGLLIDAMWLLIYLLINLMSSIDPNIAPGMVTQHLYDNPIGFFNQVIDIRGTAMGAGRAFQQVIQGILTPSDVIRGLQATGPDTSNPCTGKVGLDALGCMKDHPETFGDAIKTTAGAASSWIGSAVSFSVGLIVSWILGVIGMLAIAIAIIVAMIRLWWALLQAYIYILLNTILAPFTIFGGIIPGTKAGFGAWMKSMLANILVFPTVMAVLLLGKAMMDLLGNNSATNLFLPPLIGQPNILAGDSGGGSITNPMGMIIGFVILLITPKIVDTVKQTIGAADFKAASGIFENLGAGTGVYGAAQKGVGSYLFSEKNSATGRLGGVVTQRLFENPTIARLFRREQYK